MAEVGSKKLELVELLSAVCGGRVKAPPSVFFTLGQAGTGIRSTHDTGS
jgi:hypothetical protein